MKKLLFTLACALCSCLNAFSQATSLTVDCQTPGWLSSMINYGDQISLKNFKVTGYINSEDLAFIGSLMDYELNGFIDLTEVIVAKNGEYNQNEFFSNSFKLSEKKHLSRLDLPTSLTSIIDGWDAGKLLLDTLVIGGEGLPNINFYCLIRPTPVTIIIREGVKSLVNPSSYSNYAYTVYENIPGNGFPNTKSITLPSTLKKIDYGTFAKSSNIQHLNIPDSVEEIGQFAFAGTTCLPKTIYMPQALKKFYFNSLIDAIPNVLYFSENTTYIDNSEYYYNSNSDYGYRPALSSESVEIHIKSKTIPSMSVANGTANNKTVYKNCVFYVNKNLVDQYKNTAFYKNGTIIAEKEIEDLIVDKERSCYVGDKLNFTASYEPLDATDVRIRWRSNDSDIITLSEEGEATCKKYGHTLVTASTSYNRLSKDIEINVFEHTTGVEIDKRNITLNVGQSETISAEVYPIGLSDGMVFWKSSNEEIATVDGSGNVTAIKPGECVISCITKDREYKGFCNVKVVRPVSGISLSQAYCTLTKVGESIQLEAIVHPEDATEKKVRWSSSNSAVCMVTPIETTAENLNKVVVMAFGTGTCTITATSIDGGYTATCEVTVKQPVETLTLDKHSTSLKVGDSETLYAQITPVTADNKNIKWSSIDEQVVSVNESGVITALKAGKANIKAESMDNPEAYDICEVTVIQPVLGVSLSHDKITLDNEESINLTASIEPDDASNKDVRWSSSNENVCIVNDGLVTAVAPGQATITVTTIDGGYSASCIVQVVQHVTKVELSKDNLSLKVGEADRLSFTISPDNADDKTVIWSSSDEQVAIVDEKGNVTALMVGVADIKVESVDNPEAYDICEVTVVQPATGISLNMQKCTLTSIGESVELEATVTPEDASNKNVKWKSSDENVCIVANGTVVAVGSGVCVIIATSEDGGHIATCTVTVSIYDNVKGVNGSKAVTIKSISDAAGRRINTLQRGVNILRMSDGTTKKVVVRSATK